MRKFFQIIVLFVFICAKAQNYSSIRLDYTPSVAGVKLGEPYNEVVSKLDNRFDKYLKSSESSKETYYDVEVGGIYYKYAEFSFIHKSGRKILNRVSLYNNYSLNELTKAKEFRDYVAGVYKKKYSDMEERKSSDGFKSYVCFLNPYQEMFQIVIYLMKGESSGGAQFYYVTTSYGPLYTESTDDI